MAEERLIDDDEDKNKKEGYTLEVEDGHEIKIEDALSEELEDGLKDELEVEEPIEATLEVQNEILNEEFCRLKEEATRLLNKREYEKALKVLNDAEGIFGDGELYAMKIRALSCDFSSFSALRQCERVLPNLKENCTDDQKEELKALSGNYSRREAELKKQTEALKSELDKGRDERRPLFAQIKKTALRIFLISLAVCIVLSVTAITLAGTVMFAAQDGSLLAVTIVFCVLALISFIILCVFAHKLWVAASNYAANEKDATSEVGRNYKKAVTELKSIQNILSALENDIS